MKVNAVKKGITYHNGKNGFDLVERKVINIWLREKDNAVIVDFTTVRGKKSQDELDGNLQGSQLLVRFANWAKGFTGKEEKTNESLCSY